MRDVHKEHSECQGRFAHGNDDEGHAADFGDSGATEAPEVDFKYSDSSHVDGDYEAAADPAVVATAAVTNAAGGGPGCAHRPALIICPELCASIFLSAGRDLYRCRDISRIGKKEGEQCRPKRGTPACPLPKKLTPSCLNASVL